MIRIGVDFGGTKIEAAALSDTGTFLARVREPNPGEYHAAVAVVARLVGEAEKQAGVGRTRVGLACRDRFRPRRAWCAIPTASG